MTEISLRERKKLRRRQALHEAAILLIEQRGLAGTTIEQICDSVDVSPRTFFNYFPSKSAAALGLPERIVSPEAAADFAAASGRLVPAICELVSVSMMTGVELKRMKALVTAHPELLPTLNEWMMAAKDEFMLHVTQRAESPEAAAAALALTLGALRLLVHDPKRSVRPDAQRLQQMVDQMVAVTESELVGT